MVLHLGVLGSNDRNIYKKNIKKSSSSSEPLGSDD